MTLRTNETLLNQLPEFCQLDDLYSGSGYKHKKVKKIHSLPSVYDQKPESYRLSFVLWFVRNG